MSDKDFLLSMAGMFSSEEKPPPVWTDQDIARAVYRQSQVDKGGLHTLSVEALMRQVRKSYEVLLQEKHLELIEARQKVVELEEAMRWRDFEEGLRP